MHEQVIKVMDCHDEPIFQLYESKHDVILRVRSPRPKKIPGP